MLLKLMAGLQSLVKGKRREQEEDNDDENSGRPSKRFSFFQRGRESLAAPAVMSRERRVGEGFYRKQHSCKNMPQRA